MSDIRRISDLQFGVANTEIDMIQAVLAHVCTGHAIWWSASSTGSSNAGAPPPDMTNLPQTTLPSSTRSHSDLATRL
jgi:hypothetical protein